MESSLDLIILGRIIEMGLNLRNMINLDCSRLEIRNEWDLDIEYIETITEFESINPVPYMFEYVKTATHGINGSKRFDERGYYL